jgi:hypothetical protein
VFTGMPVGQVADGDACPELVGSVAGVHEISLSKVRVDTKHLDRVQMNYDFQHSTLIR